jgi:hypothetical protein
MLSPAGAGFIQQGPKLVGTGAVGGAVQGTSVALSADGNTVLVGGPYDGDYGNGAAWVFTRGGGVWSQQGSKLVVIGGSSSDLGYSVALSADGNTALLGSDSGTWVFIRSGGVWTQGVRLAGGIPVALSADGNTAISAGLVFTRSGEVWTQQGSVPAGSPVALSADGNTAVAGVRVFTRSGGVWTQQGGNLVGTGAVGDAHQGSSVALSADGNTAVIGGPGDNTSVGAAWVFTRSGGVWTQQGSKLVGTGAVGNAFQGSSVALSGDGNTAIVGGPDDQPVGEVGIGAAWVFTRSGGVWTQLGSKLVGTGVVDSYVDQGWSVALSADGNTAAVGAPEDDNAAGAAWIFTQNHSPDCSHAVASQTSLWPPNHKFSGDISVLGVTDADGDPVAITVTRVTQDEPLVGDRDDNTDADAMTAATYEGARTIEDHGDPGAGHDDESRCPDAVINPNGGVSLRAERFGNGNGRVYTIWFTAGDGRGGSCEGSVQVCVPHREHGRHGEEQFSCVDDGQKYNSLGPCPGSQPHGHGVIAAEVTLTTGARTGNAHTLQYSLPVASEVSIVVYDIAGRRVATLEHGPQSAGTHEVSWSARGSGMYFYRLQAGSVTLTKSVLILK